jgi:hypothetical protein
MRPKSMRSTAPDHVTANYAHYKWCACSGNLEHWTVAFIFSAFGAAFVLVLNDCLSFGQNLRPLGALQPSSLLDT